jgi:dienelactone hydrolase
VRGRNIRWFWSLSFVPLLGACQGDGGAGSCGGDLQARNPNEVVLCNAQGEPVIARVALPSTATATAGRLPGVVLLHGSAGLYRKESGECTEELIGRFTEWAQLLTERGYAVIMPESFYSRGSCDRPPSGYDDPELLVTRAYDAAAAANWLCKHPRVDCSRLAVLGFSNGASVAMLVMHEDLGDAHDPRLHTLEYPPFAAGVAYYPGCGLESELASKLDDEQFDRYFFPTGPMWIPHASKDWLSERCEELRDPQVKAVAIERGIKKDWFQLEVYAGARHGFDVWFEGRPYADREARDDAQKRTLAKLEDWLER